MYNYPINIHGRVMTKKLIQLTRFHFGVWEQDYTSDVQYTFKIDSSWMWHIMTNVQRISILVGFTLQLKPSSR